MNLGLAVSLPKPVQESTMRVYNHQRCGSGESFLTLFVDTQVAFC
jgi:hypothetical protein